MAFQGDFSSFPLPELLQWVDSSRKSGVLQVWGDAGERRLYLEEGEVTLTSAAGLYERIARVLEVGHLVASGEVLATLEELRQDASSTTLPPTVPPRQARLIVELAREELHAAVADLSQAPGGKFYWSEEGDRSGEEWVPVKVSARQLVFEALRWVDESAEVERVLPVDSLIIRSLTAPEPQLPALHQVILSLCSTGQSLGKLRLAIGHARSSVQRRVYELLRLGKVHVEGASAVDADPVAEMLEKGAYLVRERQFEAAGLVFSSLLASDPADRRVREFARMVEREHVASLYRELPPLWVPELVADAEALAHLRLEDRQIASMINGRWDVSTLVLASPSRELDTLKGLARLQRLGLLPR